LGFIYGRQQWTKDTATLGGKQVLRRGAVWVLTQGGGKALVEGQKTKNPGEPGRKPPQNRSESFKGGWQKKGTKKEKNRERRGGKEIVKSEKFLQRVEITKKNQRTFGRMLNGKKRDKKKGKATRKKKKSESATATPESNIEGRLKGKETGGEQRHKGSANLGQESRSWDLRTY